MIVILQTQTVNAKKLMFSFFQPQRKDVDHNTHIIFRKLPRELVVLIVSYVPTASAICLTSTCKWFHAVAGTPLKSFLSSHVSSKQDLLAVSVFRSGDFAFASWFAKQFSFPIIGEDGRLQKDYLKFAATGAQLLFECYVFFIVLF